MRLDLSPEEQSELEALLQGTSLNQMLGQWAALVRAVEHGYDDSIYEYTNELSVRSRLEDLIAASSASLAGKLQGELARIDDRFVNATEVAVRPLREGSHVLAFWWQRVPKRRDGELADDLLAMGHTD